MQLNSEHLSHLDEGVQQAIYKILRNEPTTTTLDLSGMKIGDKEAQALGTALQTNNTLTTLNLGSNSIGDKGAQALGTALQTNNTLTCHETSYTKLHNIGTLPC